MHVRDYMSRHARTVGPNETIRSAAEIMRVHGVGFLPVVNHDRVVGLVTDRDLVTRALARGRPPETLVHVVMTEDVVYCFEDDLVADALELMSTEGVKRLLVLNGKMGLVGIVTIDDLGGGIPLQPLELPIELELRARPS